MNLPEFKGNELLTAKALNVMRAEILRLGRIQVAAPLELANDAQGLRLLYRTRPVFYYAVVTGSDIPAFNTTTNVYGKGTATLDVESYSTSDVCTRAATSPAISLVVYNPGKDAVVVGRRVQIYEKEPGRWHLVTELCA